MVIESRAHTVDIFSREKRSQIMASIHGRDTTPERLVRSMAHGLGFHFRLHVRTLPGSPDIVFPKHHKIVFVNGCFWHNHRGCRRSKLPASNVAFWRKKLSDNAKRDRRNLSSLHRLGWDVLVLWECELQKPPGLPMRLKEFLLGQEG
jgi:DNA mismatch endonuclease (patch repair protein)